MLTICTCESDTPDGPLDLLYNSTVNLPHRVFTSAILDYVEHHHVALRERRHEILSSLYTRVLEYNKPMSRSERLQQMIDECLGGQRPKKLLPDLRKELAAAVEIEHAEANRKGTMQQLLDEAAYCRRDRETARRELAELRTRCSQREYSFAPVRIPVEQPYWSVGNLLTGAFITSAVWALCVFL